MKKYHYKELAREETVNSFKQIPKQCIKQNDRIHTKSQNKTPQFPFTTFEVYLIYGFYLGLFLYVISLIRQYVVDHFDQIETSLTRSYLSDFVQSKLVGYQQPNDNNYQKLHLFELFDGFKLSFYRYDGDPQWQSYRSNLWLLISTALVWRFLTYLIYLFNKFIRGHNKNLNHQNYFPSVNNHIYVFSFMILLFSFRADIVFYLSIIFVWWSYVELLLLFKSRFQQMNILKSLSVKQFNNLCIISFWIIMLVSLYLNEATNHFRFLSTQFEKLIPELLTPLKNSYRAIHCSQFLNMTFLRLLSYGIDRIHEHDLQWEDQENKLKQKRLILCEECKIQESQVLYCFKGRDHIIKRSHNLKDYLNYTLFTPLLLTGPPISYNNFFSFQELPSPSVTIKQYLYHIFLLLSFEVYLHLIPVVSLRAEMSLLEMEVFSLFHLIFIWYKFLIIWRTARIWAKMYGVHVIDNMSRCIVNNYGFEGFWRMWHRGFNQWLIRYLYVPLGGKENILSILAVVSFVAFWHDHTLNIVFWGLIIALFMVPEILVKRYFRNKHKNLYSTFWFKYIAAFTSSIYIHFLIICNCIGFGYGMGKMEIVFQKIIDQYQTFICSIFVISVPTLCMFHKRNLQNNSKNF